MSLIENADGLLNQWALTAAGAVVHARECIAGVSYSCFRNGCGQELRVRAPESAAMRPHLYHVDRCGSPGESDTHRLAKLVVAQRLERVIAGTELLPPIYRACDRHGFVEAFLLHGITAVRVEGTVANRRADVLVERGALRPCAIEVLVTHAVDEEKARDFAAAGAEFVELDGAELLSGRRPWVFRRGSDVPCPLCILAARRVGLEASIRKSQRQEVEASVAAAQAAHELLARRAVLREVEVAIEMRKAQLREESAKLAGSWRKVV